MFVVDIATLPLNVRRVLLSLMSINLGFEGHDVRAGNRVATLGALNANRLVSVGALVVLTVRFTHRVVHFCPPWADTVVPALSLLRQVQNQPDYSKYNDDLVNQTVVFHLDAFSALATTFMLIIE